MYARVGEKRRYDEMSSEEDIVRTSSDRPSTPKSMMEHEKRMRREIANSNERRRMQSINAGFSSLKNLLPKQEGEKLSKASILQSTAEYIYRLEQEKTRLLSQNSYLKRTLNGYQQNDMEGNQSGGDSPCEDRTNNGTPLDNITTLTASTSPDHNFEELQRELIECKNRLEQEKKHSRQLEEYLKQLNPLPNQSMISSIETEVKNDEIVTQKSSAGRSFVAKSVNKDLKLEKTSSKTNKNTQIVEVKQETSIELEKIQIPITLFSNSPKVNVEAGQTIITPTRALLSPNGTIVTLLSSKPVKSPVIEVHGGTDQLATVSTQESNIDDESTLYIMNSGNAATQKSLDTICEAIRHLEGDNFSEPHERIDVEEEVITEETYAVEEELPHQNPPQLSHQRVKITQADALSPLYTSTHPISGSMSHLTLHMMQHEPQEVPLELTTNRSSDQQYPIVESKYPLVESKHINPVSTSSQTVYSHSQSRPGVIVVKQT